MITLLPLSDIASSAVIMARAFYNEPLAIYCIPDEHQRFEILTHHFAVLMYYYQTLYDESYRSSGVLEGVCVWASPDQGNAHEDSF